jgi:hypothetical protein
MRRSTILSLSLWLVFPTVTKKKFCNTDCRSKFFVRIFADMDRSPELVKYYRKCARARLLKVWIQIVEQAELVSQL